MPKRKNTLTAAEWLKSPAGRKAIKESNEFVVAERRRLREQQRGLHDLMNIPITRF